MTPSGRREDGAVALEFALALVALLPLLAILAPLVFALNAKIDVGRVSGASARFATQVPDRARPGAASPTVTGSRTPRYTEICQDAYAALGITTPTPCGTSVGQGAGSARVDVTCALSLERSGQVVTACPGGTDQQRVDTRVAGDVITVRIDRVVDLSVFGAILSGAGLGSGSITVISTSQGRQE